MASLSLDARTATGPIAVFAGSKRFAIRAFQHCMQPSEGWYGHNCVVGTACIDLLFAVEAERRVAVLCIDTPRGR